jgi:hypothetical protein
MRRAQRWSAARASSTPPATRLAHITTEAAIFAAAAGLVFREVRALGER